MRELEKMPPTALPRRRSDSSTLVISFVSNSSRMNPRQALEAKRDHTPTLFPTLRNSVRRKGWRNGYVGSGLCRVVSRVVYTELERVDARRRSSGGDAGVWRWRR